MSNLLAMDLSHPLRFMLQWLVLMLAIRGMIRGNYHPPGPWLGLDTDTLCKTLEAQHFERKLLSKETIRRFGRVPVESFEAWQHPESQRMCSFGCWDMRASIHDETRAIKGLRMICPDNMECITRRFAVGREYRYKHALWSRRRLGLWSRQRSGSVLT